MLGLLAVPLLIGGILTWALATPTAHLDRVTAAIVNDDEPVTVNGQTVPLGRQFAAGLIGGGGSPTEATGDSDGDGDASSEDASTRGDASSDAAGSPSTVSDDTTSTDAEATNFTWVLTNDDEAASGLQSRAVRRGRDHPGVVLGRGDVDRRTGDRGTAGGDRGRRRRRRRRSSTRRSPT